MRKSRHLRIKAEFLVRLDQETDGIPKGVDPSRPLDVFAAMVRAMAPEIDCFIEPHGRLSVGTAYPMTHRRGRK